MDLETLLKSCQKQNIEQVLNILNSSTENLLLGQFDFEIFVELFAKEQEIPFVVCCESGNLALIEAVLPHLRLENQECYHRANRGLTRACEQGYLHTVEKLMTKCSNAWFVNRAFRAALEHQHFHVASYLYHTHQADVCQHDHTLYTKCISTNNMPALKYLEKINAKPLELEKCLRHAMSSKLMIDYLLSKNTYPDNYDWIDNYELGSYLRDKTSATKEFNILSAELPDDKKDKNSSIVKI